jgi:hypothetical protein
VVNHVLDNQHIEKHHPNNTKYKKRYGYYLLMYFLIIHTLPHDDLTVCFATVCSSCSSSCAKPHEQFLQAFRTPDDVVPQS